jgi:hypothetical protein
MIIFHPIGGGLGLPEISAFATRIGGRLRLASRRASIRLWRTLAWALERMMERYVYWALAGARWVNPDGFAKQQCCGTSR